VEGLRGELGLGQRTGSQAWEYTIISANGIYMDLYRIRDQVEPGCCQSHEKGLGGLDIPATRQKVTRVTRSASIDVTEVTKNRGQRADMTFQEI